MLAFVQLREECKKIDDKSTENIPMLNLLRVFDEYATLKFRHYIYLCKSEN